jgi:hypothetical protein
MDKIYSFIDNASDSEKILKKEANSISKIMFNNEVSGQSGTYINHACFAMLLS